MDTHTKEPWSIDENNIHIGSIATLHGDEDGYSEIWYEWHGDPISHKANARRIVACVNACAGIDTDNLEKFPGWAKQGFDQGIAIRKQRDELLAALKAVLRVSDEAGEDDEYSREWQDAIEVMRAAIAKAEAAE